MHFTLSTPRISVFNDLFRDILPLSPAARFFHRSFESGFPMTQLEGVFINGSCTTSVMKLSFQEPPPLPDRKFLVFHTRLVACVVCVNVTIIHGTVYIPRYIRADVVVLQIAAAEKKGRPPRSDEADCLWKLVRLAGWFVLI